MGATGSPTRHAQWIGDYFLSITCPRTRKAHTSHRRAAPTFPSSLPLLLSFSLSLIVRFRLHVTARRAQYRPPDDYEDECCAAAVVAAAAVAAGHAAARRMSQGPQCDACFNGRTD